MRADFLRGAAPDMLLSQQCRAQLQRAVGLSIDFFDTLIGAIPELPHDVGAIREEIVDNSPKAFAGG